MPWTGIPACWATLLLAAGDAVTVAAAVIPHSAARTLAIPVGIALAGLGHSLWREPIAGGVGRRKHDQLSDRE